VTWAKKKCGQPKVKNTFGRGKMGGGWEAHFLWWGGVRKVKATDFEANRYTIVWRRGKGWLDEARGREITFFLYECGV